MSFDLDLKEEEGASVTKNALAKKSRALRLRKNSIADQTAWEITKKQVRIYTLFSM